MRGNQMELGKQLLVVADKLQHFIFLFIVCDESNGFHGNSPFVNGFICSV